MLLCCAVVLAGHAAAMGYGYVSGRRMENLYFGMEPGQYVGSEQGAWFWFLLRPTWYTDGASGPGTSFEHLGLLARDVPGAFRVISVNVLWTLIPTALVMLIAMLWCHLDRGMDRSGIEPRDDLQAAQGGEVT